MTSEDIQKFVGFVYIITNTINNKKYIGKKQFYFTRRKKIKNRTNRKKITFESDWKEYYGSSEELSTDIKLFGKEKFKREILYLCNDKSSMTLTEARELFTNNVLESPEYYNNNILGKFFIKDKTKVIAFTKNLLYLPELPRKKWTKRKSHTFWKSEKGIKTKEKIRNALKCRSRASFITDKAIDTRRKNAGGKWTNSIRQRQRTSESNSKIFEIIYPNGKIEIIKNLKLFCKNNNLQASNLIRTKLNGGHLKSHKGFQCRKLLTT